MVNSWAEFFEMSDSENSDGKRCHRRQPSCCELGSFCKKVSVSELWTCPWIQEQIVAVVMTKDVQVVERAPRNGSLRIVLVGRTQQRWMKICDRCVGTAIMCLSAHQRLDCFQPGSSFSSNKIQKEMAEQQQMLKST